MNEQFTDDDQAAMIPQDVWKMFGIKEADFKFDQNNAAMLIPQGNVDGKPVMEFIPPKRSWVDGLPKATDKCEAIIHSASTLNPDGTSTEYYNRERDGHKELSELLPNPDDISILDNPFEGYSLEDIVYSQHQIILQQKKEIAELRRDLYAHNTSLNQNY